MKDLISVVVPIYNVEEQLPTCIESLIAQTYTNIEILLVNDGSKDNCYKICGEYEKKDKRIKVINKENGGLSDARNKGIESANGSYICFIDADDYIEKNFIQELYNMCIFNNVSIAQCTFNFCIDGKREDNIKEIKYITISSREMLDNTYKKYHPNNISACNKLFKIELFDDIRFPVGKIHEDEFTVYKLIYKASQAAITNQKLYNYVKREGSITQTSFNIKRLNYLEALEERMEFFEKNKEKDLYNKTLEKYSENIIIMYHKCKKNIKNSKDIQKDLIHKYRRSAKKIIFVKEVRLVKRIVLGIGIIFPNTIIEIINFKNRKSK